jgi:adenylosuccinate lyase
MIDRYTYPEIGDIWSDQNKFSIWLSIEILVVEALVKSGIVPESALRNIKKRARFDVDRILEIEEEVKHDVIAFLTNVAEHVGEDARYIHYGMTSSDVLDTALAIQMVQAAEKILTVLDQLRDIVKKRAIETKNMVMVGRSHGVHAEPITFGLKLALWYDELNRQRERLLAAIDSVRVGQISGAVGTYDHLDPEIQDYVCDKLGLRSANVTSQVLQRDRHAHYLAILALIGGTLEKIAIEIRHLQRTEVLEASEYFSKGQKGSSAMPHKKNPIISERISGLARLLRSFSTAAMENMALWHERDISHSSVERIILPDATITLYYMLKKGYDLIADLQLFPENMLKNVNLTNGLIFSQTVLLALTRKGVSREDAYRIVQKSAMQVWEVDISFKEALISDQEVLKYFSQEEIESFFDIKKRLKNLDHIFKKTGLN